MKLLTTLVTFLLAPLALAQSNATETLFYGLDMQGQTVGYVQSEWTPPAAGESTALVETRTFVKMSMLGQSFDQSTSERFFVEPDTRRVLRYEGETKLGDMELDKTIVVERELATITQAGGPPTTLELTPDILSADSMSFEHVLRDLAAGPGATKTWRALEFQTGTIMEVTYTRGADETREYLGEQIPCAVFDVKQPGLGVDGRVWIELATARLFRAELTNDVVIARASPGVVGMIQRAELDDVLLARVDTSIADYREIRAMKVRARIRSVGDVITPASLNVPGQRFEGTVDGALVDGVFEIAHPRYDGAGAPAFPIEPGDDETLTKALGPELLIEADDAVLVAFAREHTAGAKDAWEAAVRLSSWVARSITYEIPGGSARATYDARKGECGSQSRLLVALCRGAGIPARLVTGAMYTPTYGGSFGQHAWVELYMGDAGWIPVDATAQEPDFVDSGHIRLGHGAGFQPEEIEVLDYRVGDTEPNAAAAAMSAFDPLPWELGTTYTYRYAAQGESIGIDSFTLEREETDHGVVFTCKASVDIAGRTSTSTYRCDARGRPLTYHLEGKAGALEYSIDCKVDGTQLVEKVVQSGTPTERTIELPADVYLLDNNNFSGYALLASAVPLDEGAVVSFRIFHPSSMQLLPVEITTGARTTLELAGKSFECTHCKLVIAGTLIELWIDEHGRVLRESEGGGGMILELENP